MGTNVSKLIIYQIEYWYTEKRIHFGLEGEEDVCRKARKKY